MKREHIYLTITAAAVALAAAQLASASAEVRRDLNRGTLKPAPQIFVTDKPCAAGFGTSTTSFPEKGHSYPCIQLAYIPQPKCKKGYTPGKPHVIQWGSGWKVRYWCQSQPH